MCVEHSEPPSKNASAPPSSIEAKQVVSSQPSQSAAASSSKSTPTRVTRQSIRGITEKTNTTPLTKPTSDETVVATVKPSPKLGQKQRHKSIAAREPYQSFQCKYCDYSTAWKCNFTRHMLIHNDRSMDLDHLQCEHCKLPTKSQANRCLDTNDHLAFECRLCNRTFGAKDQLDMHHMTTHRHQCSKCKKKFPNEQQTDAHEIRCMKDK